MTSIRLTAEDRNALLDCYRRDPDPQVRLRAHILLLLADGHSWATITAVLFTSSDTIDRWKKRFERGGVADVLGRPRGRPALGGLGLGCGSRAMGPGPPARRVRLRS